ncbi:MAG: AEC family transporter [Sumerlaeia bacterium]
MNEFFASFSTVLVSIITLIIITLIGWICVRFKLINDAAVDGLTRVLVDLVVPAKIMLIVAANLNGNAIRSCAYMILAMLGLSIFAYVFAALAVRIWRSKNADEHRDRSIIGMCLMHNSFFLPLPLALAVAPVGEKELASLYITSGYVILLAIQWTVGATLLSSSTKEISWKERLKPMLNLPLGGICLGILLSQIPLVAQAARGGEAPLLISVPLGAAQVLGQALTPIAMLVLGMMIAQCRLGKYLTVRSVGITVLFRLIVSPAVFLAGILWFNLHVTHPILALAMMIQAPMPPSTVVPIIARRFGGDWETISATLLVTTVISLFSIPLWIAFIL